MKVLIVEDETQAAQRLESLVTSLLSDAIIVGKIDSVKNAVSWFKNNPPPDVVLMDIQLADGLSFQIFEQCQVDAPVIFTTAYDEYAVRAFKVNSVDYILKPVDKKELEAALRKVLHTQRSGYEMEQLVKTMSAAIKKLTQNYKSRFVIKVGEHLRTIEVGDIFFMYSQDKVTFSITSDNRSHILDFTLDELEELLDPEQFFRINRKYLISARAIKDIISYTNSRLRLVLKGSEDTDIIVARERVQLFKDWLNK